MRTPSMPSPVTLALGLPVLLSVVLGGCGANQGGGSAGSAAADRSTPEATYEYFKAVAQRGNPQAEWAVFSPNFKRMINEAAGRNVDVGDYTTARNSLASNSQADMKMLLGSQLAGPPEYLSSDAAVLTIAGSGKTIRPRMVKLTTWELTVAGDNQPFTDFARSAGDLINVGADGSLTVRIPITATMLPNLRAIPKEKISTLKVSSQWYVDDFGGLQFVEGGAPAEGQPAAPKPAPRPAPAPGGVGSPDG